MKKKVPGVMCIDCIYDVRKCGAVDVDEFGYCTKHESIFQNKKREEEHGFNKTESRREV